jgi:ornithine cyclodeaminase
MKEIKIIKANDVASILENKENTIMEIVANAYVEHEYGVSSLPHSIFLRFPENKRNRIIGLPAYLGGEYNVAGMKWISSFPANTERNIERASAILLMNELDTGHVNAVLESSIISAKRTSGSAAIAAKLLHSNKNEDTIGFVGCGRINEEMYRFMRSAFPTLKKIVIYDLSAERAKMFLEVIKPMGEIEAKIVNSVSEVFSECALTIFATTVGEPYVFDISECNENSTILNISLRDFDPEVVLKCDNVVDDLDHVCRENTSIHLTANKTGNTDFVRCGIADVIKNKQPGRIGGKPVMFSPFGLGVLDLALGKYVLSKADEMGIGTIIDNFLP